MRCPECGAVFEPLESSALPFCSQRCKLKDLGHWLNEDYGLPYESTDDEQPPPESLN